MSDERSTGSKDLINSNSSKARIAEVVSDEPDVAQAPPKAFLRQVEAAMTATMTRTPSYHPIFDKFTPDHVTMFLEHSHEDQQSQAKNQLVSRYFGLGFSILGVALFVFLVIYLSDKDPGLLKDLLKIAAGFAGGLGGGYGLRALHEKRESD